MEPADGVVRRDVGGGVGREGGGVTLDELEAHTVGRGEGEEGGGEAGAFVEGLGDGGVPGEAVTPEVERTGGYGECGGLGLTGTGGRGRRS